MVIRVLNIDILGLSTPLLPSVHEELHVSFYDLVNEIYVLTKFRLISCYALERDYGYRAKQKMGCLFVE